MKKSNVDPAKKILRNILTSNKVQTMIQIYNRMEAGDDGRIRTKLSPVGTMTGRFSSSETFLEASSTNLQNIPKKTAAMDPLFDIRTIMVPDEGKVLIEADLSQAEARVTSAYAGDKKTLDVFESGADIHKSTAAAIFNCDVGDVTKQQRHLGKMARHALNYGMGWRTFFERVNKDSDLTGVTLSARKARAIVERYRATNPALVRWWAKVEEQVKRDGYLVSGYGRKCIFIDHSDSAINQWIAYLPQSTVADHLNYSFAESFRELDPEPLEVLLQIHDAVLGQSDIGSVRTAGAALKKIMERKILINKIDLLIPSDVTASADSWADMEDLEL